MHDVRRIVDRLRRFLPLPVHAKPPLATNLRSTSSHASFLLTGVFDAGGEHGVMCRLEAGGADLPAPVFVVPIAHIAIDRRHPISQEIAAYRKRQARHRGQARRAGTAHVAR